MRRGTDKLAAVCTAICVLCLAVVGTWGGTVLDTNRQANRAQDTANQNRRITQQIQAGRREGQRATCAAIGAVIDAGRGIITAGIPKPGTPIGQLERSLRRLGYPPRAERRAMAEEAARLYGRSIALAVERQTGRKGLVKPDGSLDCERLARATGTK